MSRITRLVGVSLVTAGAVVAPLGAAGVAVASGGSGVVHRGSCSDGAEWKLKAKHDDGRIEVEWEVDSNRAGQSWSVRLSDNADRFFAGSRTTGGASGSFTVHDTTADMTGHDTIRARSVHGDQVCRGSVTV